MEPIVEMGRRDARVAKTATSYRESAPHFQARSVAKITTVGSVSSALEERVRRLEMLAAASATPTALHQTFVA